MPTDLAAERSEEVLRTLGMWRVPVDPLAIAKEEGIELAPGTYGRRFDARIEYLPVIRRFVIYYQEPGPGRTDGRVRFSLPRSPARPDATCSVTSRLVRSSSRRTARSGGRVMAGPPTRRPWGGTDTRNTPGLEAGQVLEQSCRLSRPKCPVGTNDASRFYPATCEMPPE